MIISELPPEVGATWPYIILCFISLLFGGHGLLMAWLKGRKDLVQTLLGEMGQMREEMGKLKGKQASLEIQLAEVRKEKHDFRGKAKKYYLLWQRECSYSTDLIRKLQDNGVALPLREQLKHEPAHLENF